MGLELTSNFPLCRRTIRKGGENEEGAEYLLREWEIDTIESISSKDIPEHNRQLSTYGELYKSGGCHTDAQSWYGCGDADEVRKLQKEGWPKGLEKARDAMGHLEVPMTRAMRRVRIKTDFGDSIDIQAVYRGDFLRAWEARKRKEMTGCSQSRFITLYIDLCANGGVTSEKLFWKGAIATVLTEELEAIGHPVEIIGYDHTRDTYDDDIKTLDLVKIKNAGQPLEFERLATVTALSGWFRVNLFASAMYDERETAGGFGHHVGGLPCNIKQPQDIEITGVWDKKDAISKGKQIVDQIEKQSRKEVTV